MSATEVRFFADYRDLLTDFADAQVDFVLIGGWAMALHGHGRSTDDTDLLIRCEEENARRVFDALLTFGAPLALQGITAGLFTRSGYGYRMGIKPRLIEILTQIDGISYGEVESSAECFELDGRSIRFIGRAALLKNTRAAGRPKDLADVDWLENHPPES